MGWTPYAELRLFRNDPRIRFKGVIHENMQDGVDEVCRSDGLTIGTCDVALHHVGYEGGQRHKIARNVPLLCAYLAEDPTRVYCWWHLGEMLLFAGDEEGAAEAWRSGIEVARKQGATPPTMNGMPYYSLLLLQHSRGSASTRCSKRPYACSRTTWRCDGFTASMRSSAAGARACGASSRRSRRSTPTSSATRLSYNKKLFSYAARESLALCHFRAGRFREAAEWYRRAAPTSPDPRACEVKAQLADAKAGAKGSVMRAARHQRPSQRFAIWPRRRQRKPTWLSAAVPPRPSLVAQRQRRRRKGKIELVGDEQGLPQPIRRAGTLERSLGMVAAGSMAQQLIGSVELEQAVRPAPPSSTAYREFAAARHG